ncbi:Developmentally-regulated GTP-binding protein 1 [Trichostrongylus colubriformis]|uniref:Developmentally-regulated GTP-binding protein 1 n=1 Tax=Trichostrongylus colubriformis TaxID=6319 RepID=A0AAN8ICT4_TRICO
MSILQKIQDIEDEMARTQKNKATNAHLGMLKAKLAKLRQELITPKGGGGGGGEGFDVAKTGDARVGFVGSGAAELYSVNEWVDSL